MKDRNEKAWTREELEGLEIAPWCAKWDPKRHVNGGVSDLLMLDWRVLGGAGLLSWG